MRPALLVQDRRRHPAKSMTRHPPAITQTVERKQQRVVAHGLGRIEVAGKHELAGEGNRLLVAASTAFACVLSGTTCGVFIFMRSAGMSQRQALRSNSGPTRADQLRRSHECQSHELKRKSRMLTADIPVDRPQQLGQLLGADTRVVPSLVGLQNVGRFDLRDRIGLAVVGDRVAHDLAAVLNTRLAISSAPRCSIFRTTSRKAEVDSSNSGRVPNSGNTSASSRTIT